MTVVSSGDDQLLTSVREQNLFRKLVRLYEEKQYRKALQVSKEILSSKSNHGETLSMRGLVLSNMGVSRKQEAHECVTRGLRSNLTSSICWQVFGHYNRLYGKYEDAAKAYSNAYTRDTENFSILRDMSNVQIQIRDFDSFKRTRYNILMLKPNQRASWVGYAVSCHLCGDYVEALNILQALAQIEMDPPCSKAELTELKLFENLILRESGDLRRALDHLNSNEQMIANKHELYALQLDLAIELNSIDEVLKASDRLHFLNPDYLNARILSRLEKMGGSGLINLVIERSKHTVLAPGRINAAVLRSKSADCIVFELLQRGCPAAYSLTKLSSPLDLSSKNEHDPSLFVRHLLFSVEQLMDAGRVEEALELVDKAIEHTPTMIEAYELKSISLERAGAWSLSASAMVEAQGLDTSDRSLNSKCARLLMRCGKLKEAQDLLRPFCRETGSIEAYMREIHCVWYFVECARMYLLSFADYGRALRKCYEIHYLFLRFFDSQYDFHAYCLRKLSICSYVRMIEFEDQMRANEHYLETAKIAITIYLRIATGSRGSSSSMETEASVKCEAAESVASNRKQERKKRKSQLKSMAGAANASKNSSNRSTSDDDHHHQHHPSCTADDEYGRFTCDKTISELEQTKHPLEDATMFIDHAVVNSADAELLKLIFELQMARGKHLLAVRCLWKLCKKYAHHAYAKECLVWFLLKYSCPSASHLQWSDPIVRNVCTLLTNATAVQLGCERQQIVQYNNSGEDDGSPDEVFARIRNQIRMASQQNERVEILQNLLHYLKSAAALQPPLNSCIQMQQWIIDSNIASVELVETMRKAFAKLLPLADYFNNNNQQNCEQSSWSIGFTSRTAPPPPDFPNNTIVP